MKFRVASAMLERMLGIALPNRDRNLGVLADIVEKIIAEPWFATEARDEFREYVADRFVSADMDDKQKRSLLISMARRFYSR